MRTAAAVALLMASAGCAYRLRTEPAFELEGIAFYGRATDCVGPVPEQLRPQAGRRVLEGEDDSASGTPDPPCLTLEVGAKSYADLLSSFGAALVALLPLL